MGNQLRRSILVDSSQLYSLRKHKSLAEYTKEVAKRRSFIRSYAQSQMLRKGQGTYLGKAWLFLDPLFQILIYALVFGVILKVSRGIDNYIGFLAIGVVFFGFFRTAISEGSSALPRTKNITDTFRMPEAAALLSSALKQFADGILPAIICIISALALQYPNVWHWEILWIIPLYLIIHTFGLGLGFYIARITKWIPDFKPIFTLLTRGLFFVSGVFFSIDRFDAHPALASAVELNPVYQFLMAARLCIISGVTPPSETWIYLMTVSTALAATGYLFFWKGEQIHGA